MASFLKWTAVFLVAMSAGAFAAPHFEDDFNKGWNEAVDAMDSNCDKLAREYYPKTAPAEQRQRHARPDQPA